MKTFIIVVLLLLLFSYAPFYLIARGMEKINTKGHGGCETYMIVILMIVLSLFGIFSAVKSCSHSNHYPSHDYYDDRTPR